MGFRIIFFLIFIGGIFTFGQQTVEVDSVAAVAVDSMKAGMLPADSILQDGYTTNSEVQPRHFQKDFQKKYKDEEFQYETVNKPEKGFFQRLMDNIARVLLSIFGSLSPNLLSALLWLIGILVMALLLYFIINYIIGNSSGWQAKNRKKVAVSETKHTENIHEINFSQKISEFERSGDYRSAVRFQFLKMLKALADKQVIKWNIEKTNRDYYNEIKDSKQKHLFWDLAYVFDYVWYGEFEIGEREYLVFKNKFEKAGF